MDAETILKLALLAYLVLVLVYGIRRAWHETRFVRAGRKLAKSFNRLGMVAVEATIAMTELRRATSRVYAMHIRQLTPEQRRIYWTARKAGAYVDSALWLASPRSER